MSTPQFIQTIHGTYSFDFVYTLYLIFTIKQKKSNFKTLIHHPKWNLVKFLDVGIENRIVWLNKRHKTTTKQMHNKSFSIAVVKWRLPSIVCIQKFLQVLVSCCFFFLLFSFGRRVRRRCFALIFFKTLWYDAHHLRIVISFPHTNRNASNECDEYK